MNTTSPQQQTQQQQQQQQRQKIMQLPQHQQQLLAQQFRQAQMQGLGQVGIFAEIFVFDTRTDSIPFLLRISLVSC